MSFKFIITLIFISNVAKCQISIGLFFDNFNKTKLSQHLDSTNVIKEGAVSGQIAINIQFRNKRHEHFECKIWNRTKAKNGSTAVYNFIDNIRAFRLFKITDVVTSNFINMAWSKPLVMTPTHTLLLGTQLQWSAIRQQKEFIRIDSLLTPNPSYNKIKDIYIVTTPFEHSFGIGTFIKLQTNFLHNRFSLQTRSGLNCIALYSSGQVSSYRYYANVKYDEPFPTTQVAPKLIDAGKSSVQGIPFIDLAIMFNLGNLKARNIK
jgi:hypothetical protein